MENIDQWQVEGGIELNEQFREVLNLLEHTKQSVFITGRAGSGKTSLLKIFKNNTKKRHVVVAPTGQSAIMASGQTIHSLFRFPPQIIFKNIIHSLKGDTLFKKLDTLIIDEISMVRADLLDGIDTFLRLNGPDYNKPFGGVQVVLVGDLYQLPSFIGKESNEVFYKMYKSTFFFDSNIFKEANFKCIELKKMFRQTDPKFLNLLEKIRTNKMEKEDFDEINKQYTPFIERDLSHKYVTITTINEVARNINLSKMEKLTTPEFTYTAKVEGLFKPENFPCDEILKLKVGTQVIFNKNDGEKRWVNGTLGTISYLSKNTVNVEVETSQGNISYTVSPETWESIKYVSDPNSDKISVKKIGSFKQYPLRLAFAVTAHRIQGSTFDYIDIHFGHGSFASGQTYTILSRCRTLEGIKLLKKLEPKDIIVDPLVENFIKEYVEKSVDNNQDVF